MVEMFNEISNYAFCMIKSFPDKHIMVRWFDTPDLINGRKYNRYVNWSYDFYYENKPRFLNGIDEEILEDCIKVVLIRKDRINVQKLLLSKYIIPIEIVVKIDVVEELNYIYSEYSMYKYKLSASECSLTEEQNESFYNYMGKARFTLINEIEKEKNIMYTDCSNLSHQPTYLTTTNPERATESIESIISIKALFDELPYFMPRIDEIFYNAPNTVVKWTDGTVTKVSAGEADFDKETGLSMCIAKRYMEACGKAYPRAAFKELVEKANDQTKKTADRKARKKKKEEMNKIPNCPIKYSYNKKIGMENR